MKRGYSIRIGAAVVALSALAACGTAAKQSVSDSSSPGLAGMTVAPSESGGTKVSANNASRAEIAAALTAAGVANADRWAGEVIEYRPYDTGDTNFDKLRGELAKYNPGSATLEKIIGVLTLP